MGASINAVGQILTRHADIEEVAEDHYTSFTGGKEDDNKDMEIEESLISAHENRSRRY